VLLPKLQHQKASLSKIFQTTRKIHTTRKKQKTLIWKTLYFDDEDEDDE
jgi:hypothetical protein